jgi:hypothetical protein
MPDTSDVIDETDAESGEEAPARPGQGYLTLKEMAEALGVGYARLRGFADAPGVKEAVGAVKVPGTKGDRYLPAAQEAFAYLIAAQDENLVTPKTAAAWLKNITAQSGTNGASGTASSNGHHRPSPPAELSPAPAGPAFGGVLPPALLDHLMDPAAASEIPVRMIAAMYELTTAVQAAAPVDPWYTLAGAAKATGLSMRTIKANVPFVLDGTRKKYAASDLRKYQMQASRFAPMPPARQLSGEVDGAGGGEAV